MSDIRKFLQKKRKVKAILRKESSKTRNIISIECKTLFVSVWDADMKLIAVGKYHFSNDRRNLKTSNYNPPPPIFFFTHIFKGECMRLQDEWKL